MAIMNTAPKSTIAGTSRVKPPPSAPTLQPKPAGAAPMATPAKKKPRRGNIGRMLSEKL